MLAHERWPNLQAFISSYISGDLLGDVKTLSHKLDAVLSDLVVQIRSDIATECWDFLAFFKDRYDDGGFLRDGFGVQGKAPPDDRGKGQAALARMKLVCDAFAHSVRTELGSWHPRP